MLGGGGEVALSSGGMSSASTADSQRPTFRGDGIRSGASRLAEFIAATIRTSFGVLLGLGGVASDVMPQCGRACRPGKRAQGRASPHRSAQHYFGI